MIFVPKTKSRAEPVKGRRDPDRRVHSRAGRHGASLSGVGTFHREGQLPLDHERLHLPRR